MQKENITIRLIPSAGKPEIDQIPYKNLKLRQIFHDEV